MSVQKVFNKIFKITATISIVSGGVIGLDILRTTSIYRPLTYLYNIQSALACQISSSSLCDNQSFASTPIIRGKNGMVVTTQHEASKIGLQILQQGGNAFDAAVGVGYALAVSDPCCGNLGGGGFMLIRLADGRETFINFREKAPLAANARMYLNEKGEVIPQLSRNGYLAVGVPGTVKGLDYALSKYGTLSLSEVIQPAIKLAEKGFILREGDVKILTDGKKKLAQPNVATIFLKDGKTPYQVGDRLIQKELAQTLKLIATEGVDGFYRGAIASSIVKASGENGGILTLEDFANYTVEEQEPIHCDYRGYEIITAPPPGGGVTVCLMLNILEGYNLKNSSRLHWMLSAMLFAYSDRNTYLGDPKFVNIPLQKLLSPDYAAQIRIQIPQDKAVSPDKLYQNLLQEGTNTTHYSVTDKYGNAVAVTYTINSYFGAGVIAGNTGFILNNEMDDFTSKLGAANQFGLVQGKANIIEPGKRPLSSMSPTIVTKNERLFLVTGSPGGSTIPTTVLQTITNMIDFQMDVHQAVNSPRFHYQGLPNAVLTEPNAFSSEVVEKLWKMGYKITPFLTWGAAESISFDEKIGIFQGANDNRKSAGEAIGY